MKTFELGEIEFSKEHKQDEVVVDKCERDMEKLMLIEAKEKLTRIISTEHKPKQKTKM